MRAWPQEVAINDSVFTFEKILKDDFFSVNVLYRNQDDVRYVLKLSDFRFIFGVLLRPLAVLFSRREYTIYRMVADIEGVPALGPRHGLRGYFHEYVEGKTLHEIANEGRTLPEDFFEKLMAVLARLHERRIFYLDLNKSGNIILGDDQKPYLIDFQICLHIKKRSGLVGLWSDRLLAFLIREDIYHLYKHKRYFQPHLMTPEELALATRTRFNVRLKRYVGEPYRAIKRLIYPHGSNEIIWYRWRKLKDKSSRMP